MRETDYATTTVYLRTDHRGAVGHGAVEPSPELRGAKEGDCQADAEGLDEAPYS